MRRTVPIVGPGHPFYEWRPAHLTDIHATFDRVERALAAAAQAGRRTVPGQRHSDVSNAVTVMTAPAWEPPAHFAGACTNAAPGREAAL